MIEPDENIGNLTVCSKMNSLTDFQKIHFEILSKKQCTLVKSFFLNITSGESYVLKSNFIFKSY